MFEQKISEEIFYNKYMINGEKSPEEVFIGVAKEISNVEKTKAKRMKWFEEFSSQLSSGKLIPAGRILANARPETKMPYYNNCYTIGVEDSIDSIYNSLKEDANISKTGGGVGLNFSNIRPKGSKLSSGGESSGVISFMKVFNESAKIIMTGGQRRSAHIGVLNVDHPEIEAFIKAKQGEHNGELTQFNISVGITDKFMEKSSEDPEYILIKLKDTKEIKVHKDEEIKIDGKVYLAKEYNKLFNN